MIMAGLHSPHIGAEIFELVDWSASASSSRVEEDLCLLCGCTGFPQLCILELLQRTLLGYSAGGSNGSNANIVDVDRALKG